ncbi:hypothetical protein B0920_22045 [Massilia sp. KIM]|uniref:hypothetical protein n=1 Tax=Massilia sp. KIM TaxID=1955422 RepID=UPI00098F0756|nr:hypothetical protein [Massilia sp. KIM]OON59956.1 hypothetical protein B0920_22045 [Massilia sp. KIM]
MSPTLYVLVIALAGLASLAVYAWRRQWLDALLVAVATVALALFAAGLRLPGDAGHTLAIDPAAPPSTLDGVRALTIKGDGLRAAQWHDLPARPLNWQTPQGGSLRLDFPQQMALGRIFSLKLQREDKGEATLELLAENGQVLARAKGEGELAVDWLPPVAEPVVLKARLLDAANKLVAEGPVPFIVQDPATLQVEGRFGAPSFDLRVLNELLAGSGALLDWKVTLSRAIVRSETPRAELSDPSLMVVDAGWFERAAPAERAALLERVGQGRALLVLGASANEPALWSRSLQLSLQPQEADRKTEGPLAMQVTPLAPAARQGGPWSGGEDMVWTRDWKKGRIAWVGVAGWHQYAISEPRALALWWQGVLDRLGIGLKKDTEWLAPDEMPLPGQRLEICARGVSGQLAIPELKQTLAWQRRPERADASCVALWPEKSGWLQLRDAKAGAHAVYVYAPGDWPQWQAAQRREATARYAARTPAASGEGPGRPMPAWPFALAFAAAMLLLWWRERR